MTFFYGKTMDGQNWKIFCTVHNILYSTYSKTQQVMYVQSCQSKKYERLIRTENFWQLFLFCQNVVGKKYINMKQRNINSWLFFTPCKLLCIHYYSTCKRCWLYQCSRAVDKNDKIIDTFCQKKIKYSISCS